MATFLVKFETPRDITHPGFDGRIVRFPYIAIEELYLNTPRQSSKTVQGRISVEISRSLLDGSWKLEEQAQVKVLFQFAREHLANAGPSSEDTTVKVNSYNQPNVCPFDVSLIPDPDGAVVEVEVSRKIGFV